MGFGTRVRHFSGQWTMDVSGLLWTSVDDGLWTEVDISGEWTWTEVDVNGQWSFRHLSCPGFQPAKLYHAYSHALCAVGA